MLLLCLLNTVFSTTDQEAPLKPRRGPFSGAHRAVSPTASMKASRWGRVHSYVKTKAEKALKDSISKHITNLEEAKNKLKRDKAAVASSHLTESEKNAEINRITEALEKKD